MRRLCLRRHCTVFQEKSLPELFHDFFAKRPIVCRIFLSAENAGNFRKKPCGISKIRRTGQVVGRRAEIASLFRIQSDPVAELKPVIPYMVHGMLFHKANPFFHAVVLFFQNRPITESQIHRPGIDHRHIRPGRRGMRPLRQKPVVFFFTADDVRHHMGHTALRRLVRRHVFQPLPEKSIGIHQITGRPAENLRVSRPAYPFVPLRTVRRYIQKISF